MSDIVFRQGKRVLLRPLERADIPTLRRWMNDPEITQFLMRAFPLMEKEEEEWIENKHMNQNDVALGIVTVENKKLIGSIGLHGINWQHRTATTGTVLGEKECWGKGYGTEAKMLLLDFAFNTLDLYGVVSRVLSHNGRSLAYGKKCGYEEVGRLPQWIRRQNGERCDEVLLIVTQEKWGPLWQEYLKNRKAAE
ncbi:MAG: GCN5-related N-acetyltransferase [Candidatus Kaiserbacteria bacterium]|nr:GCN5-related N-acetyltransferase [Candidatus Kaiserbacteria bacterium]